MEPDRAIASKRRALVDALMLCLHKSRVVDVVDADTVRGVLDSAAPELWRENAFWLEPVWQLLTAQPGVDAAIVAPPLFAFKSYEVELGVAVRLPHALTALPRTEQARLRDALAVTREEIARVLDDAARGAAEEQSHGATARLIEAASAGDEQPVVAPSPSPSPSSRRRSPALALTLGAVAVVAVAGSAWFALRDTARTFSLDDAAVILQLEHGKAVGPSLTATIADPKWELATPDDRRRILGRLFDIEAPKGIRALSLIEQAGATRATISDGPSGRVIILP